MCALIAVAIAAVSGCRTAAARPCVPAEGVEVWEIQRYASAGGDSSTATISVGVTPVSQAPVLGGSTRARQPVLRIVGPLGVAAPDTVRGSAMRADGQIPLPPRRLRPGVYQVRLIDLGWAEAVREVRVRGGERVEILVQMRLGERCPLPVVRVS